MPDWKDQLSSKFNRSVPPPQGNPHSGRGPQGGPERPNIDEFIITDSFFNPEGNLKHELFCDKPRNFAIMLVNERLKSTALRQIFNSYLKFAMKLRDGRITFDKAREQFDIFYTERIVRQNNRRDSNNKPLLPDIVVEFVNRHKELAMRNEKEMLGFFQYLKSILCYFQGR